MWINPSLIFGIILVFDAHFTWATLTLSDTPSDHLVPPPLVNKSNVRHKTQQPIEEPSFMGRIAGWFGFGGTSASDEQQPPTDNQITDSEPQESSSSDIQQRYYYDQPTSYTTATGQKVKITCNPCNKVPWTPMVTGPQLPLLKTPSLNTNYAVQYQHVPVPKYQYPSHPSKQNPSPPLHQHASYSTYTNNYRPQPNQNLAGYVQQNHPQILIPTYASGKLYPTRPSAFVNRLTSPEYSPPPQLLPVQDTKLQLIPIPIPNLSITPIPPIFASKPFRSAYRFNPNQDSQQGIYTKKFPSSIQDLLPPQVPTDSYGTSAISNSDIEIIRSVSLGEYTSSIEYPPAIIQSPVIDLTENRQNQKNIYASAATSQSEYITEPIVVNDEQPIFATDNYPAASSHNRTADNDDDDDNYEQIVHFRTTTVSDFVLETTTVAAAEDGNTAKESNVQFLASIQTDAQQKQNDRETPKDLLDTPLYYVKKTSVAPQEFRLTTLPKLDYSSWQPSTIIGLTSPTARPFAISTNHTSPLTSKSLNDRLPPIVIGRPIDKKPKQIQIIIPYTTKNQPRPFRKVQNFDPSSGWSYNSNDFHDSQESKVVEATVTTEKPFTVSPSTPQRRTTKYLTKIHASNLRELLAKEGGAKTTVDLSKLQKNIDGWTEQEFSMLPNRASTISLRGQPKIIPSDYFTSTVPSVFRRVTTTMAPDADTTVEPLFSDEPYGKKPGIVSSVFDNNGLMAQQDAATMRLAKSSRGSVFNSSNLFWQNLKMAISPITKERVYVVTPQPRIAEHADTKSDDDLGNYKSPRFVVRPTPGAPTKGISQSGLTILRAATQVRSN